MGVFVGHAYEVPSSRKFMVGPPLTADSPPVFLMPVFTRPGQFFPSTVPVVQCLFTLDTPLALSTAGKLITPSYLSD